MFAASRTTTVPTAQPSVPPRALVCATIVERVQQVSATAFGGILTWVWITVGSSATYRLSRQPLTQGRARVAVATTAPIRLCLVKRVNQRVQERPMELRAVVMGRAVREKCIPAHVSVTWDTLEQIAPLLVPSAPSTTCHALGSVVGRASVRPRRQLSVTLSASVAMDLLGALVNLCAPLSMEQRALVMDRAIL